MDQNQAIISLAELAPRLGQKGRAIICSGFLGADKAFGVADLYRRRPQPMLVLLDNPKAAEDFYRDLCFFLPELAPVIYYPPYNVLPFKFLAYHNETVARRTCGLYRILESEAPPIVVAPITAIMQKIIPKKHLSEFAELIMVGEEIDFDGLVAKLVAGGYTKTALVEEPGDFSVRGGILDIFSPMYEEPFRIELFGDLVESMRFFDSTSQRTRKSIKEAVVLPAREAIIETVDVADVVRRVRQAAAEQDVAVSKGRELIERIKREGAFPGIESILALVYAKLDSIFDYLPQKTLFIPIDPAALSESVDQVAQQVARRTQNAKDDRRLAIEFDDHYLKWEEIVEIMMARFMLTFKVLSVFSAETSAGETLNYHFDINDNGHIRSKLSHRSGSANLLMPLSDWIKANRQAGYMTLIVCQSEAQTRRLKELMAPYGLKLADGQAQSVIAPVGERGRSRNVYVCTGRLSSGFVWPGEALAVITDAEIFGSRRTVARRPHKEAKAPFLAIGDLKQGDLVVHVDHGVGAYDGLVKLDLDGITNDFLLVNYRDADKLYLPVDRMNLIQKYMGVGDGLPLLDKMGGKSWQRVKDKVKKSARKIANELLKLYASRKVNKGFAFEGRDQYFRDFEAGFAYDETEGQIKALEDVLGDMQSPRPMDRLVCGDVGYGKTEVALRAAFLALNNNKQVAILVPTTVLAEQHQETFVDRFKRYPVNIASLSRFRSPKEQREIISGMAAGNVDIVIGTHRLLQKDIAFKDLGLLILDEEHRFGVKHKERLKNMRANVDVLTLTATPIPRTLHMSLTGVRDISVITTPPARRRAIVTYISEFEDTVMAEAIRKELARQGQIFFVHNNIKSIAKMAAHLKKLVPEVRLEIAHGRMSEDELETAMQAFMSHEVDMLVCTTIIESGLDIPSANTILINRADRLGLAQIYQLRGRVGRADEQAYAYLFIPAESTLSKDAQKRLKVLMEYQDLGSGFQLAMNDLKIRGGGSILGASQSGHIAAVGYDMFLKLMEEAVAEIKGKPHLEPLEPEINLKLSAYIPERYITNIDQRLTIYRRLARSKALKELADFKAELIDRFGPLPKEASNLLLKMVLKILAAAAGAKRLDVNGTYLQLAFSPLHQAHPHAIVALIETAPRRYSLTPEGIFKARLLSGRSGGILAQTKNILKEIARHVNG